MALISKFTDPFLRSLQSPEGQIDYADSLTPGLMVRVGKRHKTFMVRRVANGRRERITLGHYPDLSLSDARTHARKLRAEATLGLVAPKGSDYEECLEEFLVGRRRKNKASTADETERLLRRHFDFRGEASKIDDRKLETALDAIAAPSEARHAFVAARTFFNWMVKARRIPFSPLTALEAPRKGESRERVLTDDELVAVWVHAPEGVYGQIVRLLIVTGQRPGQFGGLKGEYILPEEQVISWPGEAMKANRRHTLPLPTELQQFFVSLDAAIGTCGRRRDSSSPPSLETHSAAGHATKFVWTGRPAFQTSRIRTCAGHGRLKRQTGELRRLISSSGCSPTKPEKSRASLRSTIGPHIFQRCGRL